MSNELMESPALRVVRPLRVETGSAGEPAVSGRMLHEFLGVETRYRAWFPRMCEYGFIEGLDFRPILGENTGERGRPQSDHIMTLSMAKELCMIARTERGREARRYFISVEREWNSPEKVIARALKLADAKIRQLVSASDEMRPKAMFADAVAASDTAILIGDLAKILRQNGVDTGANRLFAWLRENGYIIRRDGSDYNMPTQKSMELGLFQIKERTLHNPDGSVRITRTPKVTGKGQIYFINKLTRLKEASEKGDVENADSEK